MGVGVFGFGFRVVVGGFYGLTPNINLLIHPHDAIFIPIWCCLLAFKFGMDR